MYDKICRRRKRYRGRMLYVLLAVSLVLCAVTVSMAASVIGQKNRFKAYIQDFSKSTNYAYSQGYITARMEDRQRKVVGERIYSLYNLIVNSRGIMEQSRPQTQPEITVDFGDNSKMEFWVSELENATNNRKYGLLIYYRNQEGDSFCYDTDRLEIGRISSLLKDKLDYMNTAPAQ